MKTFLFSIIFICVFSSFGYGQVFRHFLSEDLEKTQYGNEEWKKMIREREIVFEQYFKNEYLLFENDDDMDINLQVVFNIIQTEGKKVNYDQIKAQVKALNAAFNNELKMPEDDYYKDFAVDANIQFCVPEYNENYIKVVTLPSGGEIKGLFAERGQKGLSANNPDKYINIWVVDMGQVFLYGGQEFSIAGYSQLPMRDPIKDGIVIDIDHFGQQPNSELYKEGYTLAHLMGIYLGIRPLWGLDGLGECGGDGVDDTPTHGVESLLCFPQTENQVVSGPCWGNERMMNKNFMDNVPDNCAAMFTIGQTRKMRANLGIKGPRRYLISEFPIDCNDGKVTATEEVQVIKDSKIKVYPNPSYNQVQVSIDIDDLDPQDATYDVYSLTGQKMATGKFKDKQIVLDVNEWVGGMYFIVVNHNHNEKFTRYSSKFEVLK
jgi:hypothetical protein